MCTPDGPTEAVAELTLALMLASLRRLSEADHALRGNQWKPFMGRLLQGKVVGDSIEVKLEPDDAFGEYDAELVIIEPRRLFPENIEIGMQFERAGDEGEDDQLFTITEIADDKVVVDGNHPLAGLSLVFSCTVADIRQASGEVGALEDAFLSLTREAEQEEVSAPRG